MESPQSAKELQYAAHTSDKQRLRLNDENVHFNRCTSPESTEGTVIFKEVNEATIKGSSPRTEEGSANCTPLRVFRLKRQSLHAIELNSNQQGTVKTPVTNGKKTPVRVPINPFDAVLLDRLHLPICSPSIFTKISDYEEEEFQWNIEEQATLFPVPIEEELHVNHHMHEHYDAELESKIQEAIDRFYEGRVIAPSPWIEAKKCGLMRGLSDCAANDTSVLSPRTQQLGNMLHKEPCAPPTREACTQTQLSLPLNLPEELVYALQKYTLPHDGDSGSASSSMIGVESESFSTSTRRKLFNVEDMSISQAGSLSSCSQKSPTHNSLLHQKAVSSSPVKGGTIVADFDCGDSMDESEIHSGILESSKTTFWKATSSPDISPIASQRLSLNPECSPQDEARMKSKYDDMQTQYTPPSSRTRQRPFFPYSFAPLLEKDEDKLNEEEQNEKETCAQASSGNGNQPLSQDDYSSSKEGCSMGESKSVNGFSSSHSLQNVITQSQKVGVASVSQYQQQISQVTYERFDSIRADDTCLSRMQDTGYQTVSMTTLPGSSVSYNSLRLKSGAVIPTDSVSMADKIQSCPMRINEDGYTSLSFNKIPAVSIYNDESMTDVWHSSPPPLASSTPAKNFGGFLM
ncbi:uncharacterized protein LOC124172189 [Ischnura elegans]|uniref:uncharacterized protein LOC124172189 n=1 Tax=Ischnura elegans TaxID=197161 RepID=UPI001ED89E82|nr:uncharacterized protein LOC124172189 [Ischnura elegans]